MTEYSPDKLITILVGTETGTAEELAAILSKECFVRGASARICALSEYPIGRLPSEDLVLFVVSTAGQGQPPSTMKVSLLECVCLCCA